MEGQEAMVNGGISDGVRGLSCGNGLVDEYCQNGFVPVDVAEKAEEVLEKWDEYWEDISDRLMISRMVSDSLIKGMVSAVEQGAAEKIAAKELEVTNLKERLMSHEVGTGKYHDVRLSLQKAHKAGRSGRFSCSTAAYEKHEKVREDLNALRNSAIDQFKKLKKEIGFARGSSSMKKICSSSELVGLGGILHENQSENWMLVDKMLDNLKTTVDIVCKKVDDISFCDSRQDLDMVKQAAFSSPLEEFENSLVQDAQFCVTQYMNWLEKFNDISSLGTKLDAILKSLSGSETVSSHGSHDLDHLLHKASGNDVTSVAHYGENGTVDASNIHVSESYDFQQLKHMSKGELVDYFNDIITKLKRDHESALHRKTEDYFRLKREYLKEKGSFTTHRKDEEFDVLKKISEVILKLDDFLSENENFPALVNHLESMGKLKHRLERLLCENRDLRDCLIFKENEVKDLKTQVSGAAADLLHRSLAEENLKSAVEDSCIEISLSEEVYKFALREQIAQTRWDTEDSNMKLLMTREIYDIMFREAASPAETANIYGTEDSDIESLIMQELNGLVLTEAIRDSRELLEDLCRKVLIDEDIRICLEAKLFEKENEIRLEIEEEEKLKQEILCLRTTVEQKEKFAMDLSVLLSHEREQFELASRELISLREHASQLQTMVTERKMDMESLRSQHLEALEQIEVYKMEMLKLNQKLDQTKVVLEETNKERDEAFALAQEMHEKVQSSDAREQLLKKEMDSNRFSEIFDEFECTVSGAIKSNNLRLKDISCQLQALAKMANVQRRTGLMYQHKLQLRGTDLQMAEAEVDLLGDEVDALLRLLEKIYIALDHYSPVLKHYPGIIEILELVRRELTGESTFWP